MIAILILAMLFSCNDGFEVVMITTARNGKFLVENLQHELVLQDFVPGGHADDAGGASDVLI